MANLTKGQPLQPVGKTGRKIVLPVKATSQLWESAMVAESSGGALVTGTTAGAGDCVGIVTHDALGGATDGAIRAEILTDEIFRLKAGTNAPTDATSLFAPLFMEDDNSVGTGAVGQRFAGLFMGFEDDGFVRVYVGNANAAANLVAVNGANLADTATQNAQVISDNTRYTIPTMSQGCTVTLVTTNAVMNDFITIARTSTAAFTLTVANGGTGAGNVAVLVASKVGFVSAWFNGTDWKLDSCSGT